MRVSEGCKEPSVIIYPFSKSDSGTKKDKLRSYFRKSIFAVITPRFIAPKKALRNEVTAR